VLLGQLIASFSGIVSGNTVVLGMGLTVGYGLLVCYALVNPGRNLLAGVLLGLSTLVVSTLLTGSVRPFFFLSGNVTHPLLAAVGFAVLAGATRGSRRILQWVLTGVLVAEVVVYFFLPAFFAAPSPLLWTSRALHGVFACACLTLAVFENRADRQAAKEPSIPSPTLL
jgi:hypothetical protein